MGDWYLRQGDTLKPIEAQLVDPAGEAIDLTGMTVQLTVWDSSLGTVLIDRAAAVVVTGDPDINVRYQPTADDVAEKGTFAMFWTVVDGAGKRWSVPNFGHDKLHISLDPAAE